MVNSVEQWDIWPFGGRMHVRGRSRWKVFDALKRSEKGTPVNSANIHGALLCLRLGVRG